MKKTLTEKIAKYLDYRVSSSYRRACWNSGKTAAVGVLRIVRRHRGKSLTGWVPLKRDVLYFIKTAIVYPNKEEAIRDGCKPSDLKRVRVIVEDV